MERHEAWADFVTTRDEVLDCIRQIVNPDNGYHAMVKSLDDAIDSLHDTLCDFGHPACGPDDYDDITTPLFDCCSYLTEARSLCRGNGVRVVIVQKIRLLAQHAREQLDVATHVEAS